MNGLFWKTNGTAPLHQLPFPLKARETVYNAALEDGTTMPALSQSRVLRSDELAKKARGLPRDALAVGAPRLASCQGPDGPEHHRMARKRHRRMVEQQVR